MVWYWSVGLEFGKPSPRIFCALYTTNVGTGKRARELKSHHWRQRGGHKTPFLSLNKSRPAHAICDHGKIKHTSEHGFKPRLCQGPQTNKEQRVFVCTLRPAHTNGQNNEPQRPPISHPAHSGRTKTKSENGNMYLPAPIHQNPVIKNESKGL